MGRLYFTATRIEEHYDTWYTFEIGGASALGGRPYEESDLFAAFLNFLRSQHLLHGAADLGGALGHGDADSG